LATTPQGCIAKELYFVYKICLFIGFL